MNGNIVWILELTVKEGKLEELKKVSGELSSYAKENEPGTLVYEWMINENGKKCHIYERYVDSEAAVIHLEKLLGNGIEKVLAVGDPASLVVYGNPSQKAKEILNGLGAVYMEPIGGFIK